MSTVAKIALGVGLVTFAVFGGFVIIGGITLGATFFAAIGASLILQGITQMSQQGKGTSVEAGKVNVRLAEPIRWLNAGINRQGGGVLFAEFDGAGNLWYVVVHSDSQLNFRRKVYLDDVEVSLDAAGNVTTNDFCLNEKREAYTGSGARIPYFQIWTTTYSATNPTPPGIADLQAAFPGKWTPDHKLVGTTYSVVRCAAIKIEDRYKIYKWRGPLGLGEPSISILGEWALVYDPRDGSQILGNPATYKFSRNNALIWAWFRTHRYGRNKAIESVNWARVAEQANVCDENVVGIEGSQPRYTCTVAIPEDRERSVAEQEILMAMDAQLVFDGDGKCWPRAGKYYPPTLSISRNRDVIAMESLEAQNGESETQGVVVRYTEPQAKYVVQPAAPWYNPLYYIAGKSAQFLTVDIPTIDNHNQAMRVAKSMGMRSQPLHKLAPTTGLRGLRARQERVINLTYDNTFAGDYEIHTPVEVDQAGMLCQFGLVPIDADRFDLLLGEEKTKPVFTDAVTVVTPTLPTAVNVTINNGRIEATFTPTGREDIYYEFQYIAEANASSDNWLQMSVVPNFAYSDTIPTNVQYRVRWRSVASSGRPSAWSVVVPITNVSAISPATNLTVTGNTGNAVVAWRNPNDLSFYYSDVYRSTGTVFANATKIVGNFAGGVGQVQSITDTVAAGTYNYWVVSRTNDNRSATPTGPIGGTVK